MALDDDGTPGRQRRGGVATGGRKGERKIRCAEHRNRPERDHPQAKVGAWQRLAFGHGGVHAKAEPRAAAHDAGEQLQLPDGTPAFALQSRPRQAALAHRGNDQIVANRDDLLADPLQKARTRLAVGRAVRIERGLGRRAGRRDIDRTMRRKRRADGLAGLGDNRAEAVVSAVARGGIGGHITLLDYSDI